MSFILDALNKSNADAARDAGTLLQTAPTLARRSPLLPLLFAILLIANAGFGAWWLLGTERGQSVSDSLNRDNTAESRSNPGSTSMRGDERSQTGDNVGVAVTVNRGGPGSEVDVRATTTVRDVAVQITNPDTDSRQAVAAPALTGDNTPSYTIHPLTSLEHAATRPSPAEGSQADKPLAPVPISALPLSVQEQIPDLAFSSHIHANDPRSRMVNINGRFRREGDTLARGLTLLEITQDGVVLGYLHYTFEVGVIRDWAF